MHEFLSPTPSLLPTLQGVDLFTKSFVFIPIHEALHWSLIVACNLGKAASSDSDGPVIMHLDSLKDGEIS